MAIPVTMADAKRQLRIDDGEQDVEIAAFIEDAADWVENYTGHILRARSVTETFDSPERIRLRAWPIKPDATIAVSYLDAAGAPVPLPGWRLDVRNRPARVLASASASPAPFAKLISVTFSAGYEEPDFVPGNLRRAMLVLISAYDADREGGDILAKAEATARKLCSRFKARAL